MITKTLYKKTGAYSYSLTPEGEPSGFIRLIPGDGKWLSDGTQIVSAIDIVESDVGKWVEVDAPPEEIDPESIIAEMEQLI